MKINLVTSAKQADIIKFKIKTEHSDRFFLETFDRFENHFIDKGKTAVLIFENPRFQNFEDKFCKIEYGTWASNNLNNKGYETSIPKSLQLKGDFDLYFFMSSKAQKKLSRNFESLKGVFNYAVDAVKASIQTKKFSRQVGGARNDTHYSQAAEFLFHHELNKYQDKRFQKMLKKFQIQEVKYNPPKIKE